MTEKPRLGEVRPRCCRTTPLIAGSRVRAGRLEAGDQFVEAQLLQPLADSIELTGGVLDEFAALLDQVERFAQAGLVRVEPGNDRLQALDGGFVGARLSRHRNPSLARGPEAFRRPF